MLNRLERAIELAVEGSVASVFRLSVQPAEIGRRLERAMLDGRKASVGTTLAPNAFAVRLHPEDVAAFDDWEEALCRELETWLAEVAYARGLATVGAIRVRIVEDANVRRRTVSAAAQFSAESPARQPADDASTSPPILRLAPRVAGHPEAILRWRAISVGRAPENDLVLPDPGVSRHHARIELEAGAWCVVDLDSTNGTWLNSARVQRGAIQKGDDLAFGGVRFTVRAR